LIDRYCVHRKAVLTVPGEHLGDSLEAASNSAIILSASMCVATHVQIQASGEPRFVTLCCLVSSSFICTYEMCLCIVVAVYVCVD